MVKYKKSKKKGDGLEYKKPNLITKKRVVIGVIVLALVAILVGFAVFKSQADKKAKQNTANKTKTSQGATKSDPKTQKELAKSNVDRIKDRVKTAEKNGNLTKDQSSKILKKLNEVSKFNDSLIGKSSADQSKLVIAKRKELRDWAKANSIPNSYVSMMIMRF